MEIKVLITRKSCDYHDQVGSVIRFMTGNGLHGLTEIAMSDEESIYLSGEDFCPVFSMVTRSHDGMPVLLTPQEAEEFDSKIKRNKIFLQPSDG